MLTGSIRAFNPSQNARLTLRLQCSEELIKKCVGGCDKLESSEFEATLNCKNSDPYRYQHRESHSPKFGSQEKNLKISVRVNARCYQTTCHDVNCY